MELVTLTAKSSWTDSRCLNFLSFERCFFVTVVWRSAKQFIKRAILPIKEFTFVAIELSWSGLCSSSCFNIAERLDSGTFCSSSSDSSSKDTRTFIFPKYSGKCWQQGVAVGCQAVFVYIRNQWRELPGTKDHDRRVKSSKFSFSATLNSWSKCTRWCSMYSHVNMQSLPSRSHIDHRSHEWKPTRPHKTHSTHVEVPLVPRPH